MTIQVQMSKNLKGQKDLFLAVPSVGSLED